MRKFLLVAMAVVMVMGISRTATAEAYTANDLLQQCESKEWAGQCEAYVIGVFDGISAANDSWELDSRLCFPKDFTASQLTRMFFKSANENPEKLHFPAVAFLFTVTASPFFRLHEEGSCPD